jgi:hypothetical protein
MTALVGKRDVSMFDASSLRHFGVGFAAGWVGINPTWVIVGLAAWEVVALAQEKRATKLVRRESPVNHLGDVLAGLAGAYAGRYFYERRG